MSLKVLKLKENDLLVYDTNVKRSRMPLTEYGVLKLTWISKKREIELLAFLLIFLIRNSITMERVWCLRSKNQVWDVIETKSSHHPRVFSYISLYLKLHYFPWYRSGGSYMGDVDGVEFNIQI